MNRTCMTTATNPQGLNVELELVEAFLSIRRNGDQQAKQAVSRR